MKAFILFGIIFSSLQFSIASESRSLTGQLKLNNSKVEGALNEATLFGLSLYLDFKHQLNDFINIKAIGGVSLETGESEDKYSGRTFRPTNSLGLKHASLEIRPFDLFSFEIGAINQSYHNNPLFLTNTAFVAAREILSYEVKNWTIEVDMIQAIPSNYSLSQKLENVEEGSSRFFNEKVRVIGAGDSIDFDASLGHFAFDKLNSSIAYNSRLLGNTVSGVGAVNNKFQKKYLGWNGDLSVSYKDMKFVNVSFEAAVHKNQKADAGKGRGYLFGPVFTSKTFENKFRFALKVLRNEADSTVAYYSSKYTGQTNREGLLAGISVFNKAMELEYGVDTYFTKPIDSNSFQEEEKIINFSLRKSYDFL